jgi:dipeptidase
MDFCVKITSCKLNELEPNSIDIMCSSIIDKYINRYNQYELLSLIEFNSFYNIKKKIQNIAKPKLLSL